MGARSRGVGVVGLIAALCVVLVAAAGGALPGADGWSLLNRTASTSTAERSGVEVRGPAGAEAGDGAASFRGGVAGQAARNRGPGGALSAGADATTATSGQTNTSTVTGSSTSSTSTTLRPGETPAGAGLSNVAACASQAITDGRASPSTSTTTMPGLDCPIDFSCLTEVLSGIRQPADPPTPAAFASLHECIAQIVADLVALIRRSVGEVDDPPAGPVPPTMPDAVACVRSVFQPWSMGRVNGIDPSAVAAEVRRCLSSSGPATGG